MQYIPGQYTVAAVYTRATDGGAAGGQQREYAALTPCRAPPRQRGDAPGQRKGGGMDQGDTAPTAGGPTRGVGL